MKKWAVFVILALLAGAAFVWLYSDALFRIMNPVVVNFRTGKQFGNSLVSTRSLAELEELVYRSPFDVDLQLELARAAWKKFVESLKTDEGAGNESLTAYLIAYFESGARSDIAEEVRGRYDLLAAVAGLPPGNFENTYSFFEKLYPIATKANIQHILNIRKDLEIVCAQVDADEHGRQDVVAAQVAVERYLQLAYDIEIGRKRMSRGAHETFHLTKAYYKRWEDQMRSYGVELGNNPDIKYSEVAVVSAISDPFDRGATQVTSGDDFGRFVLPDGRRVLPGLRYFQDISASLGQQDVSKAIVADPSPSQRVNPVSREGPVDAYERFLRLREQGRWSETFDYFDADGQLTIARTIREAFESATTDQNKVRWLANMSDREVEILGGETGEVYPTQIIRAEVAGNRAELKTRTYSGERVVDGNIEMTRVSGVWKLVPR